MSTPLVHHHPGRQVFETVVAGQVAHLEYREHAGVLTILHTIVPAPLGGCGLGAALVETAIAYAASHGLQVASECWYATRHIAARQAPAGG